jgi:hypothetical protein
VNKAITKPSINQLKTTNYNAMGCRSSTYCCVAAMLAVMQIVLANTVVVPPYPVEEASVGQWIAGAHDLDGPKVQPINDTAYDWWYYDIVSSSEDSETGGLDSMVIVFYTASADGFTPLGPLASALGHASIDLVQIVAGYANGTTSNFILNSTEAIITTYDDNVSGVFTSDLGNISFSGSADSSYTVTVDTPKLGITGTLDLTSVRAHPSPST